METLINNFSIGLFFWQSVLFIGLIFLLKKFAWKPILDAVAEREQFIEESLESAERAKVELARLQSKNEDLLKAARAERDELLKAAKETKEKMVSDAKGIAKTEAEKIMVSAKEAIENEKLAAVAEIKTQVATLSLDIAEKILRKELSAEDKQKALVGDLIEGINLN
jgi:F-type H+-transporting ATPase subunit b